MTKPRKREWIAVTDKARTELQHRGNPSPTHCSCRIVVHLGQNIQDSVLHSFFLTLNSLACYLPLSAVGMAPAALADAGFPFLSDIEAYHDVSASSSSMATSDEFLCNDTYDNRHRMMKSCLRRTNSASALSPLRRIHHNSRISPE